jgi:hypothetical protein
MDRLVTRIKESGLESAVRIKATFCFETAEKGPKCDDRRQAYIRRGPGKGRTDI